MDNLEKEIKRKINIRKTAIKNMGLDGNELYSSSNNDRNNNDEGIERLYFLLNDNIKEANEHSYQNAYWTLYGKKISIFVKKILRKFIRIFYGWFLFPIVDRQSHFNGKTVNSITILKDIITTQKQMIDQLIANYNDLQSRIEENSQQLSKQTEEVTQHIYIELDANKQMLHKKVEDLIPNLNNRIEENNQDLYNHFKEMVYELENQTKEINQKLHNEIEEVTLDLVRQINDNRNSNDYFQSNVSPRSRFEVRNKASICVEGISDIELKDRVQQVEQASVLEVNDKLMHATDYYIESVHKKLEDLSVLKKELIVIFCLRFRKENGIEAIKNEAFDLFKLLSKESKYDVKLLSLEEVAEEPDYSNMIMYVDKDNVKKCIDELAPSLMILIESTPYNIFDYGGVLIKNHTLIKLTGQNPLQGLKEEIINELRHCNDFGIHHYFVESQNALNVMVQNGFRNVLLSYPIIDLNRVIYQSKEKAFHKPLVVGFASSPMAETQYEDRGMNLLLEIMKNMPDVSFKILWRNELLELPTSLPKIINCEIYIGRYDMEEFYKNIDCIIIPYTTSDNNHACSLSGLEAMLNNIPVISTSVAGISDIVNRIGMGLVCEPTCNSLVAGINTLIANYNDFIGYNKVKQLLKILDPKNIIPIIENTLLEYFPKNFVTLSEWDYYLSKKNKYLVKGHNAIKEYYQNKEIAVNYNADRFLQYPANYYDAFERASIGILINAIFKKKNLEILDIASGDGRIVQEVIKYGLCTSIDSSNAMLDIVEKRFKLIGKLQTITCDYFTDIINYRYDIITTFRYIRHYDYKQRRALYKRLYNNLKCNGILIFDAPNIKYAMKDREQGNWDDFNIYDVFWTQNSIIQELSENGFEAKYLIPIGVKTSENEPVSWTVAAIKK